jgi:FdhE protein
MSQTTLDAWLSAHSYLQPLARLTAQVESAAARIETPPPAIPEWNGYAADFRAGFPLLRSPEAGIDLEPAGKTAVALVEKLSSCLPTGSPFADISLLEVELRDPEAPRRIADWLLGDEGYAPSSPGLLRYLGWIAAGRYLAAVVSSFGTWRDEEKWLRNYCPTCGSGPAMAQLVGADPGRRRLLTCGCCKTRWQYRRTQCPFCENDSQRLSVIAIEGEAGLRIDYCESCRGYLKTYDGQGNEDLLLSDWTSLHLDAVAHDRGLRRVAASLYQLEAFLPE